MFAVIMAGGSGTRFWPASRERLPKQFLKITSDKTIFEETLLRVRRFASDENIYAVVGQVHADLTRAAFGESKATMIVEPVGRNTSACIGLAAIHIARRAANEPIIVLPSDQYVANVEDFADTIRAAAEAARDGAIVTIGITPTRPETGYGYIEVGAQRGHSLDRPFFKVNRFVEKPVLDKAKEYLASGNYLWNSGIFVFTAETILQEIQTHVPSLFADLKEIEASIDTPDYDAVVARLYPQLHAVSIDVGVMEKTERAIQVLKGDFGWSDVGSWQSLYELRTDDQDEAGNLLLGEAKLLDAKGNLVYSSTGRVITLLGVEGLAVIDTPDALMVARIDRSQDVKKFPDDFKKEDKKHLC